MRINKAICDFCGAEILIDTGCEDPKFGLFRMTEGSFPIIEFDLCDDCLAKLCDHVCLELNRNK